MAHSDIMRPIAILWRLFLVISLVIAIFSYFIYASRVSDKIYHNLQSNHYCNRRLNATHQMGCTSELGGNVGVLWEVITEADLTHVMKTGLTPPYILMMNHKLFTRKNIKFFAARTDRINGVILINSKEEDGITRRELPFSPEDRCPNKYSGLYVNNTELQYCKRNLWQVESQVSGLLYDDIPFPIFYINEEESIDRLRTCFTDNNLVNKSLGTEQKDSPLCNVQLDSFMLAASDTKSCLTSHSPVDDLLQTNGIRCTTVENQNIFGYLKTTSGPVAPYKDQVYVKPGYVEPRSIVLVVAKLSSISMFTELSSGADSVITSIITLLTVAEALAKARNTTEVVASKRNIAFALLDSEPFDYTGSSRMVYDMSNGTFPNTKFRPRGDDSTNAIQNMNLTSIDYILNLDQMAIYPGKDTLYLHSDPEEKKNIEKLGILLTILKRKAEEAKIKIESIEDGTPLPPASVQEFIKASRELSQENEILGVVLGNYKKTYSNLFYHSIYDDARNVHLQSDKQKLVEHLTQAASLVAKTLYELTFAGANTDNIAADSSTVGDLLSCYMTERNCSLFTKVCQIGESLPEGSMQTFNDPSKQPQDMNVAITTRLLAYFLRHEHPELNVTQCAEENEKSLIYNYQYINGKGTPAKELAEGLCIAYQVFNTRSDSPAYLIDGETIDLRPGYSAWTISLNNIRNPVRVFLVPSLTHQWIIFSAGLSITAMAFIAIHQFKKAIPRMRIDPQSATST